MKIPIKLKIKSKDQNRFHIEYGNDFGVGNSYVKERGGDSYNTYRDYNAESRIVILTLYQQDLCKTYGVSDEYMEFDFGDPVIKIDASNIDFG